VHYLQQNRAQPLRHVLSNSFGFGGSNASLVLGRHERRHGFSVLGVGLSARPALVGRAPAVLRGRRAYVRASVVPPPQRLPPPNGAAPAPP
jgi:hypothetical protein